MKHKQNYSRLLPYPVILAATQGDVEAMHMVLQHYAGYIATLSMPEKPDDGSEPRVYVNEDLRRRLETKLITAVVTRFHAD